jgi:hypothetical protein
MKAKSNELRQVGTWTKASYEPGDGDNTLITSKSELHGDKTPATHGRHGEAQGRKDYKASVGNQTPSILDREPSKETKPWANAPAEAATTHERSHWTVAEDAGSHPPAVNGEAHGEGTMGLKARGPNVGSLKLTLDGDAAAVAAEESDLVTKSGEHQHSAPSVGDDGKSGWKRKGYTLGGGATLPEGSELQKKWRK